MVPAGGGGGATSSFVIPGIALSGPNLATFTDTRDAAVCLAHCRDAAECSAWTVDAQTATCALKSAGTFGSVTNAGSFSSSTEPVPPAPPSPPPPPPPPSTCIGVGLNKYYFTRGTKIGKAVVVKSYDACAQATNKVGGKTFNYLKTTRACQPFKETWNQLSMYLKVSSQYMTGAPKCV